VVLWLNHSDHHRIIHDSEAKLDWNHPPVPVSANNPTQIQTPTFRTAVKVSVVRLDTAETSARVS
jgi:hypothetical protein